jgi:hypothetical protein
LFFSGEEPHYFSYPEGHFHPSELENAKETETVKSFLGRMVKKYSKDDRELTQRTPISPPISAPASASSTAEESEDNANPHRNPTIAESSTNVTDDHVSQYIRWDEDLPPSRDGVESNRIPGFSIGPNREAMPGAQNHSPGSIMPSCWDDDTFDMPSCWDDDTFDIPSWEKD